MRHAPFAIGPAARDAGCARMREAIDWSDPPPDVAARAPAYIDMAAEAMRQPRLTDPSAISPGNTGSGRRDRSGGRDRRWRRRPRTRPVRRAGRAADDEPHDRAARQDRPRRGRQRRPPRPRPGRRRGRGLPRDRAQRARPGRAPRTTDPADGAEPGHRRRPRLRQPVRPADRAPRPRAQRLLASSSRTTRRAPSSSAAAPEAIILSGGPNSVYDDGCAEARPGDLVAAASRSSASATARS